MRILSKGHGKKKSPRVGAEEREIGVNVQGFHPCTPPKNFLKKVLWNLKNF